MLSADIIAVFREEMNDEATPYLWSDTLLYSYLDIAQKDFCRRTEGIEDSATPAIAQATILAGEEWVTLDPRILKVRAVTNAATGRPFKVFNAETAPENGVVFNGRAGAVEVFVTGLTKHKLRAWPKAAADTSIELSVFRLPLDTITDAGDQTPEIDEQHHYYLTLGMKALAYGKEDAETFNRSKAEEYDARFRAYCAQARREQGRLRRDVGTVSYGGL